MAGYNVRHDQRAWSPSLTREARRPGREGAAGPSAASLPPLLLRSYGSGVPHLHRLVPTPRDDALAVGGERHAVDRAGVPLQGDVAALELVLPVVPLEAAEVLVPDLARPLLLQQLQEAVHLVLLPGGLRQEHPHAVRPSPLQPRRLPRRRR